MAGLFLILYERLQQTVNVSDVNGSVNHRRHETVKNQQIAHRIPDIYRRIQHKKFAALLHKQVIIRKHIPWTVRRVALSHVKDNSLIYKPLCVLA